MGKVTDSLLSGTRGRTGRIVVTNTKGVEVSRMRPRRSSRQATPKQQLVKDRFNLALRILQGYKSIAKVYFGKSNGLRSPYNNAMSNAIKAVEMDFDALTLSINYEGLAFTKGELMEIQPTNVASNDPLTVSVEWVNNATTADENEHQLVLMYMEDGVDKAQTFVVQTALIREVENYSFQVLPKFQNKILHLWGAFMDSNLGVASNSLYLGTVTVA